MKFSIWGSAALSIGVSLGSLPAFAAVGKIAALEGKATRAPEGGQPVGLAVGAAIELKDTLHVEKGGNLKLVLTDETEVLLASDSELFIAEADFQDQTRESFTAKLGFGKLWTHVKKAMAGSDAKFQIQTDKAVAGVRGTIFRVDAVRVTQALKPRTAQTIIKVLDGKVGVDARVKPKAQKAKGERHQISGPAQVSSEQWEKKFIELQKGMEIRVGDDLWEEASFNPADSSDSDAFGRFVEKNK